MFTINWSVMAERSSALDSSSGVVRMWVRIPAWPVAALVSLSKTLNHNCFVLRMGRKAVGPVCCVMHVKEPRTLIVKEKGLAPAFLDSRLEHPTGWICAHYKSYQLSLLFNQALVIWLDEMLAYMKYVDTIVKKVTVCPFIYESTHKPICEWSRGNGEFLFHNTR